MNVAIENCDCSKRTWRMPVAWLCLIAFDLCLVALVCGQDSTVVPDEATVRPVVIQLDGPADVAADEIRFEAIDVFVDPGEQPLAAYQFELESRTPGVEIVGIEGGEHEAFAEPPYYDPRAMNQNRVIIAAFNGGNSLPTGRSRVARIHVQLQGPGVKEYETRLTVSATKNGERIPATASVSKSKA